MKGFPNQVSNLETLAGALKVLIDLEEEGQNAKNDGVFGEALVRRGVLGTGHKRVPVEEYLAEQKSKRRTSDQSYRTRARGLRELFRVMGFIDDRAAAVVVAPLAKQVASLAGKPLTPDGLALWRAAIVNIIHDGGDGESSHPYQVLLRLVARRPSITRAKCALALEARNDSEKELSRIVELSDLEEPHILQRIGVTQPNWDNAKKILPRFAEELRDVQKVGQHFFLSDAPGILKVRAGEPDLPKKAIGPRKPRSSRAVTADTIAKSGTTRDWDEAQDSSEVEYDANSLKARNAKIKSRLKRHNAIVKMMAKTLEEEGAELFENPFDCFACFRSEGLLLEVKSLDGTENDEMLRVREALGQLLYYEAFVTRPLVKKGGVIKVACFENKISDAHIGWLAGSDIHVLWTTEEGIGGSEKAKGELAGHFGF